jgi:hypothetical protein
MLSAGEIEVEPLAAFDLEDPKAVTRNHRRRLGRHGLRRLPRERPRDLNPELNPICCPSPEPPHATAETGGMKIPAGVVDQRLGRLVLWNPVQHRADLCWIIQIDGRHHGQQNVLERRDEAAGGDAAPGRLHRDLGNADRSGVALQAQQHERRRLLDDVAPSYRPLVAQSVAMQRMLGETHGALCSC